MKNMYYVHVTVAVPQEVALIATNEEELKEKIAECEKRFCDTPFTSKIRRDSAGKIKAYPLNKDW